MSIVSHGQADLVDGLIRQLARQTAFGLIDRVVLTLNIPEKIPDDWAKLGAFELKVIRNRRPDGFAANHNRALAGQTQGIVAVLNPDLQLVGDPLSLLCEAAMGPGVGLVAPIVLEENGEPADSARDLLTPASVLSRTLLRRRHPSPRSRQPLINSSSVSPALPNAVATLTTRRVCTSRFGGATCPP